MENLTSSITIQSTPAWTAVNLYHPYFVGGLFAVNAILSLGYLIYVLRYRAYNHMGGLISGVLLLTFLFSTIRSLLIVQSFSAEIHHTLQILDCLRTVSISSVFGLTFIAIVRSSESEFVKAYVTTKIVCFICVLLNYGIALLPTILRHCFIADHLVPKAVQVACDMYFMTSLFIMGLAYIFMLPKTLSMSRDVKSGSSSPKRILSAALVNLLAAVILLVYIMFLLLEFLTDRLGLGSQDMGRIWREWGAIVRHAYLLGISASEAVLTGLFVVCAALLIRPPHFLRETSHASAPETQGLLYPGRNTINAPSYRAPAAGNGYHHITLYKADNWRDGM